VRVVVQRVTQAAVRRADATALDAPLPRRIGPGLVLLVGFRASDDADTLRWMAAKCLTLRIFPDAEGALNRSVTDCGGSLLVVPNFTLYGDASKGRRPSFTAAAPPARAQELFARFVDELRAGPVPVAAGWFQAPMHVELTNDGPVTLVLEHAPAVAAG
jgi:D-tyrosyl-tRNA(Tyr) deacylase